MSRASVVAGSSVRRPRRLVLDTRPLAIRPYRRLWASTIVTAVGSQLTVVAIPVQLYTITGSSAYVGLAGLSGLVALIVFGLWGGAIADVVDRRRMLLVTTSGIALTSTLLWAQAAARLDSVAVLLVLVAVQRALFGASAAAGGAAIPRLVPTGLLAAANALGSTIVGSARSRGRCWRAPCCRRWGSPRCI